MRNALWLSGLLSLVLGTLVLGGCGGDAQHPLAGTYVMDVEKTLAVAAEAGAGKVTARETQAMRQDFAAYVLVLSPEGAFDLRVGEALHLEGRWAETDAGVSLATTRAGGEPVADADAAPTDARVEGAWIVLVGPDGRRMYLRRA
jgi:hypothetical protein